MLKRSKFLTLAAALLLPLAACDEGDTTTPAADNGTISGSVTIDGAGASGVTVTLSNGASVVTAAGALVKSRVVCKSERKLLDASVRLPWRPPSVREA